VITPRAERAAVPEYRAVVHVMLRRAILDPQGRAVHATLERLGHANVTDLRVGKRIELVLAGERDAVEAQVRELATTILSNPVMEDAVVELHEVEPA
jgi:phosphoribosylformylglycinamidine synthase subunit PurS